MRAYRRNRSARRGGNDNSFWLSFSDLMSSLVLIIILVMFYIIYQYFNLAEINQAEIARREYQLDVATTELEDQKTKLSDAEKQMIAQQILLDAKQKELDDAQSVLEAQKTELETTQAQLNELGIQLDTQQEQLTIQQAQLITQQNQLSTQQDQLSAQKQQLADQQQQIEQLVGLKPRIIASLSSALKQSIISASVDAVTGSIALKSDVLFESGRYELTAAGRSFVDRFLPVYLNVLFSDEYKSNVSEIIIEGHTDSDGGYLYNLELSQQRALAVANYVLGDSCKAVSGDVKDQLRPVVTVNGRSSSDLILDANGVEDKDASRRVVFKFRLTDEQMIQQLRQILETAE